MRKIINEEKKNMIIICDKVRVLVINDKYEESKNLFKSMIGDYPHAPEPHPVWSNFRKRGRSSFSNEALSSCMGFDPTYLPARYNLENFGTFVPKGRGAYDESDCQPLIGDDHRINMLEGKLCL